MKFFYLFLAASVLHLWSASRAWAAPVQGSEPAIHVGGPPPATNVPTFLDIPNWRVFTSAEGGFSILLPSAPAAETRALSVSKETMHLFHCRAKHESYIVQYVDKDPKETRILGPDKILSVLDDAAIKVNRGSVISSRRITLEEYPGRELVTRRLSGNIETQRMYLVANRLYILTSTHPPAQTETLLTNSDKFLDSFKLLPAKLPSRNQ